MNAYVIYAVILGGAMNPGLAPPDLSGVWSVVAIRPAPANAGGAAALPPSDITIQQTQTDLKVSRTAFDITNTATYALDGRESTNKSGAVTRVMRARWDGARLVIEGRASQVTSQGYAAWKIKETYSLDARAHLLIESEHTSDDGVVTKSVQELVKKKARA